MTISFPATFTSIMKIIQSDYFLNFFFSLNIMRTDVEAYFDSLDSFSFLYFWKIMQLFLTVYLKINLNFFFGICTVFNKKHLYGFEFKKTFVWFWSIYSEIERFQIQKYFDRYKFKNILNVSNSKIFLTVKN